MNEDFKAQLELEEREKRIQENATTHDPYHYRDPNDGTLYEWNHEKQAWFPKITDDFIAAYQASYGITQVANAAESQQKEQGANGSNARASSLASPSDTGQATQKAAAQEGGEKRKASDQPPGWFEVDDEHNTNVYVSNLPEDITEEEFVEFMSKCGIIMKDTETGKLKMKLYTDSHGKFKGDALCCYIKVESVELALNILNGYTLRGKVVHVERAKFQMKGTYDPTKKPKKKKSKDKKKIKHLQEKLLDWRPERSADARFRFERTVVIKNMFDPKEFEEDATLILEYQSDLREECSKFGTVKKVVVYDRHPEGVASVTFETAEMGDECIKALNGRWFAKRQLNVSTWDGRTKYSIEETMAETEQRLKQWESFLEKDDADKSKAGGAAAT